MSSKIKTLFFLVLAIGIAYFGYNYFIKKDTPVAGLVSTSTQAGGASAETGSQLGNEFLKMLLNMKVITLDSSIIQTAPYTQLKDFTKILSPDTNPGRPNPFAPIGTEGAVPVTPSSSTPQPTITPVQNGTNTETNTNTISTASVETGSATAIQAISVSLNGNLLQSVSGSTVWFEYGTNPQSLTTSTARSQHNLSGVFAVPVSGLRSATTYYYRAAAKVNGRDVFGQTLTFRTR